DFDIRVFLALPRRCRNLLLLAGLLRRFRDGNPRPDRCRRNGRLALTSVKSTIGQALPLATARIDISRNLLDGGNEVAATLARLARSLLIGPLQRLLVPRRLGLALTARRRIERGGATDHRLLEDTALYEIVVDPDA